MLNQLVLLYLLKELHHLHLLSLQQGNQYRQVCSMQKFSN